MNVPFVLRRRWLLGIGLCVLAGCGETATEPVEEWEYFLGKLEQASVAASGDTLTVYARTFGNTCWAKGVLWFDVDRRSRQLTVSTMDRKRVPPPGGQFCLDIAIPFDYTGTIELEEGTWVVVIRGRASFVEGHPERKFTFVVEMPRE